MLYGYNKKEGNRRESIVEKRKKRKMERVWDLIASVTLFALYVNDKLDYYLFNVKLLSFVQN